jgi:hypothetical protein
MAVMPHCDNIGPRLDIPDKIFSRCAQIRMMVYLANLYRSADFGDFSLDIDRVSGSVQQGFAEVPRSIIPERSIGNTHTNTIFIFIEIIGYIGGVEIEVIGCLFSPPCPYLAVGREGAYLNRT